MTAPDKLLMPGEVARLFHVSRRTVRTWARQKRLRAVRTLGGHHRYYADEVYALLERGEGKP